MEMFYILDSMFRGLDEIIFGRAGGEFSYPHGCAGRKEGRGRGRFLALSKKVMLSK